MNSLFTVPCWLFPGDLKVVCFQLLPLASSLDVMSPKSINLLANCIIKIKLYVWWQTNPVERWRPESIKEWCLWYGKLYLHLYNVNVKRMYYVSSSEHVPKHFCLDMNSSVQCNFQHFIGVGLFIILLCKQHLQATDNTQYNPSFAKIIVGHFLNMSPSFETRSFPSRPISCNIRHNHCKNTWDPKTVPLDKGDD